MAYKVCPSAICELVLLTNCSVNLGEKHHSLSIRQQWSIGTAPLDTAINHYWNVLYICLLLYHCQSIFFLCSSRELSERHREAIIISAFIEGHLVSGTSSKNPMASKRQSQPQTQDFCKERGPVPDTKVALYKDGLFLTITENTPQRGPVLWRISCLWLPWEEKTAEGESGPR